MKFKVIASSLSYYTLELEANSEHEAFLLAKDTDGGDFQPDGEADWVIVNVTQEN